GGRGQTKGEQAHRHVFNHDRHSVRARETARTYLSGRQGKTQATAPLCWDQLSRRVCVRKAALSKSCALERPLFRPSGEGREQRWKKRKTGRSIPQPVESQ